MKKLIVLVCAVVFLFGVIGIVQAQSDWAYYKEHPIEEDYTGPRGEKFITNDELLDCCACHGPDAPGNHGGPQLPAKQCP